jgi:hypothetical protein
MHQGRLRPWRFLVSSQLTPTGVKVVVLQPVFVAHHLAIDFIYQTINRSVQVFISALSKQIAAFDADAAFSTLAFFFLFLLLDGQQHLDIDQLIKVAGDLIELIGNVSAQCRRDVKVVTTDCQIHKNLPWAHSERKAAS